MARVTRKQREARVMLPAFETYGNYKSDNYGAHALVFTLGSLEVWFSYQTPVAFRTSPGRKVVRVNEWGPTTGKHLIWIDGGQPEAKRRRISGVDFERLLGEVVAR